MTDSATHTYLVPEISCDHCKSTIEQAVGALDQVRHVEVDVAARTVTVEGGASPAVIAAIEDAGYDVAP